MGALRPHQVPQYFKTTAVDFPRTVRECTAIQPTVFLGPSSGNGKWTAPLQTFTPRLSAHPPVRRKGRIRQPAPRSLDNADDIACQCQGGRLTRSVNAPSDAPWLGKQQVVSEPAGNVARYLLRVQVEVFPQPPHHGDKRRLHAVEQERGALGQHGRDLFLRQP